MKELIRQFILQAIHRAEAPLAEVTIKAAVRGAFPGVAITEADLAQHIRWLEELGFIVGTNNPLIGNVWALTDKGKLAASQLT